MPSGFTVYTVHKGLWSVVRWTRVISGQSAGRCVPGGQLSGSDGKNHDDAKYDDHDQVDGQHDLLETMTLHIDTQTYV